MMVATIRRGESAPVGDDAAAKDFQPMEAKRDDRANMVLREPVSSPGTAPDNDSAWLVQAIRLRDRAFQLAQSYAHWDLQAAGSCGSCIDQGNAALQAMRLPALTADYLLESEKMIDLMREMAKKGLLVSPTK